MDEVADELSVSKKTIYKCFPSKDKLVEEIADSIIAEISSEMARVIDDTESDVVSKFVTILDAYNRRIVCCSERWYRDLELHAPHVWKKIESVRSQRIYESLGKLIKQGRRENLIENFPPEIVIASFIAMVKAVGNPEFLMENKFTMHDAFRYSFEILMNGILTEEGKRKYRRKTKE
jgi:AcrR family transcriptional regulator